MTHKEAFEVVKTHLLTQNAKAQNNEKCLYRADDGKKCAVGILIPDEQYNVEFDIGDMNLLRVVEAVPALNGLEYEFLASLQRLHDTNLPSDWPDALTDFERYRLPLYAN